MPESPIPAPVYVVLAGDGSQMVLQDRNFRAARAEAVNRFQRGERVHLCRGTKFEGEAPVVGGRCKRWLHGPENDGRASQ